MILFYYGNDNFQLQEKNRQIKNEFIKNNPEAPVVIFDFDDGNRSIKKLENTIDEQGLFSSKKLVIVKNFINNNRADEQKGIIIFLQNSKIDNDTQLVFTENKLPRKNSILFKFLLKEAKAEELNKLEGLLLYEWVQKKIKKVAPTTSIQSEALNRLVYCVGNNLAKMSTEIEKLASYRSSGKDQQTEISVQDIDLLVATKVDANIFETIEAISISNKKKALELLHKQLKQGDDPFYIFSMYIYQFRNLLKIADFYFQGYSNQYEIAKLTKLHPFVVKKGIEQLRNFSLARLKEIYKKLEEIDIEVKTGQINIEMALDTFIVK